MANNSPIPRNILHCPVEACFNWTPPEPAILLSVRFFPFREVTPCWRGRGEKQDWGFYPEGAMGQAASDSLAGLMGIVLPVFLTRARLPRPVTPAGSER